MKTSVPFILFGYSCLFKSIIVFIGPTLIHFFQNLDKKEKNMTHFQTGEVL